MFFLVIVVTVILSTDMEGVPDDLLVAHLKDNILLYSFHYPLAHVGIMLLAVGYGMDLDERVGCLLIPFGAIAAPCFPVITFAIMRYAQIRRRRSGGEGVEHEGEKVVLGNSFFTAWADLLVDRK